MSNANIELIKNLYAAFGRGDIQAVFDTVTPDVSWGMVGRPQDVPWAGIRTGRAGVGEFFRLLNETKEMRNFEPQKFVAGDDMVFVWGHYDWAMRASGASGASDFLHIYTIDNGRISSWRGHQDTAALAAAHHAAPQGSDGNDLARLLEEGYQAFARGDIQPVLDLTLPDVSWGMIGNPEDVPFLGIRQGIQGMISMFQDVGATQELQLFQPHGVYVCGDIAFVPGLAKWTMRKSGVTGENEWVHVYRMKDGKIASFRGFTDTAGLADAYRGAPIAATGTPG